MKREKAEASYGCGPAHPEEYQRIHRLLWRQVGPRGKGAFPCMVPMSPPNYHTGILGGLMPEKEKIPDYGHNMLQEEEIEFLTNICPHKVDESSERTEPPQGSPSRKAMI